MTPDLCADTHPTFLVVDDDPMVRRVVSHGLKDLGPECILEVEDGLQAQQVLRERHVDVVVTDVLMPNMDGRDLMKWAQENYPEPVWIVLSSLDTFDAAVEALHLGAFDYLAKPPQVSRVRVAVRNALDHLALVREQRRLHEALAASHKLLAEKVKQLEGVCGILEDQADVIRTDLSRAEIIQRALLPQLPPSLGPWCVETVYRPGRHVGGDYYDVVSLDNDHIGLVIADAAGHGVAAAMLSVLFKHRLKLCDDDGVPLDPCEVLRAVNSDLYADASAPGMFITAVYALLDRHTGTVKIASAGHPPVVCTSQGTKGRRVSRTGPALGLRADAEYDQVQLALELGDRMLFYTDGVLEGGEDSMSVDDLCEVLAVSKETRANMLRGFYEAATESVGEDRDDVTMVLLERSAGESRFDTTSETHEQVEQTAPPRQTVQLMQGQDEERSYLSIAGHATWMRSTTFFEVASQLMEARREMLIDLTQCEYLDSTFLGTIHEIVASRPESVRVQGVSQAIRDLFEELDMKEVLDRVRERVEALPEDMSPLRRGEQDITEQGQRVLRSHEILSSLSAENQEQFRGVVESLRSDLGMD